MRSEQATRIPVRTAAPYEVVVGHGVTAELPAVLGRLGGGDRVGLVHPATMARAAQGLHDLLADAGHDVHLVEVPDGEAAKTADVAAFCWGVLGRCGFTRSDVVITLGGGATTDLGGFVAASWLRGVAVVHVPTTLLGMVDAAVGGKTGINTAEGKNLVGAFHEPAAVLCDLEALAGLPRNELVSGLAEVVKCGFVADPTILALVEDDPAAALDPGSSVLRELVERAVRVKAAVVAEDLTERAGSAGAAHPGREVLNYGHTLGHAVERLEQYRYRHGAAVAIGMVYVAELAARAGSLAPAVVERHRSVLELVGLPTRYRAGVWDELHAAMRVDKKARGATLRFVVLDDLARPRVLAGPSEGDLRAAYRAISEGER